MKYKVIRIIDMWGEEVNLDHYDVWFVKKDCVYAYHKGTRFMTVFSKADCYTVITEEV